MHWTNFDRLYQHLTDMLTTNPQAFNYMKGYRDGDVGCVACHCVLLDGRTDVIGRPMDIQMFLGVSEDEAVDLWTPRCRAMNAVFGPKWIHADAVGVNGIRVALAQLDEVAAKYPRPSSSFVPNEAAFLDRARQVAREAVSVD